MVKALLEAGAEVDSRSASGETPVINSAQLIMHPETLVLLLEAGADVDAKNKLGTSALHAVILNMRTEELKEEAILSLVRFGADVLSSDVSGVSAWDLAEFYNMKKSMPKAYWALNDARFK